MDQYPSDPEFSKRTFRKFSWGFSLQKVFSSENILTEQSSLT